MNNDNDNLKKARAAALGVPRNCLDRKQMRRVEDWVAAEWPTIESTRPTLPAAAAKAGDALGFTITPANLTAAVHVLDRTWPNPKQDRSGVKSARANLHQTLATMANAIAVLYRECGEQMPPDMREVAARLDKGRRAVESAADASLPRL